MQTSLPNYTGQQLDNIITVNIENHDGKRYPSTYQSMTVEEFLDNVGEARTGVKVSIRRWV
jgi:hypothetical protein